MAEYRTKSEGKEGMINDAISQALSNNDRSDSIKHVERKQREEHDEQLFEIAAVILLKI